jgi:hypothetical protein
MTVGAGRARAEASRARTAALEALAAGFYWGAWASFKALRLVLLVVAAPLWGSGWLARRAVWPAARWSWSAVRLGWDDARDGRRGGGGG